MEKCNDFDVFRESARRSQSAKQVKYGERGVEVTCLIRGHVSKIIGDYVKFRGNTWT